MKTLAVIILCLVTGNILGQDKSAPVCFLNSEVIDIGNVYIRPSSIEAVNVEKKAEGGEVHITTKASLTFLSLDTILKKYSDVEAPAGSIVYTVNGKLVTEREKVKIDDSYFIQVDIKRFDKVTYIREKHRDLILVDIQLLNDKSEQKIMIRGGAFARAGN